MKATQNRRLIGYLAPAIAAALGFGAHVASAAPCITPAPATATATATVQFKVGAVTASATTTATFNVPAPPNNCIPPQPDPHCIPLNAPPTFTGGKATIGGITVNATFSATGTWQICFGTNGQGQLKIPQNGLTATASVLGQTCTTKAAAGGTGTVSGPFTNGLPSTLVFTNASVPVTTSGGFPCPSATSATFSGTFTTSPNLTFQ